MHRQRMDRIQLFTQFNMRFTQMIPVTQACPDKAQIDPIASQRQLAQFDVEATPAAAWA